MREHTGILVDEPGAAQIGLSLKDLNIRNAVPSLQSSPNADAREARANAGKPAIRSAVVRFCFHFCFGRKLTRRFSWMDGDACGQERENG